MAKKKKSMKSKTVTKKKYKKTTVSKKNNSLTAKKKTTTRKKNQDLTLETTNLKNSKSKKINTTATSKQKQENDKLEDKSQVKRKVIINEELPKRKQKEEIIKEELPKKKQKEEVIKAELPKKKQKEEIADEELSLRKAKKEITKENVNIKEINDIVVEDKKEQNTQKKEIEKNNLKSTGLKKKNKKVSNVRKIERTKKNALLSTIKKYYRKVKIYGIFSIISKRTLAVITSGLVILLFLLVGLNYVAPKTNTIDLQSISSDIDQLKTVKFNINSSNEIVTSSNAYSDLTNYYVYDYKSTFNIDEEWIKDAVIKYNKSNKGLYMAILPNSGYEENIKNGVNKFLKSKNIDALYLEYDGYMFYINSSNNTNVVSKIKQTQVRVFDILEELNTNSIENIFGISSDLYTDYVVKNAMLRSDITGYMIFKPKNKNAALKIDELMDEYFKNLEEEYKDDEDKLFLLKNRYEGTYNGYLVYLVSKDNDLVLQLVKK